MELLISPDMKARLDEAGIREEEVRSVFAEQGGVLDPTAGTLIKGGQVGSITLWIAVRQTETGYVLENLYCHRMTVEGVEACPGA